MSDPESYIGVDIGGTKIAAALVTPDGEVLCKYVAATPTSLGGKAILDAAFDAIRQVWPSEGAIGIGIGTGGQVDPHTGVILSATDLLPGWAGIPVKSEVERIFDIPAQVDNDVNALAVGEGRFGAAKGKNTVLFLALGTGVGGALLINNCVHHGSHGGGGEFGHLVINSLCDKNHQDRAPRRTLEEFASGSGLVETWRELSNDFVTKIDGYSIGTAALRGNYDLAKNAVSQTGKYLGYGLVSLANCLDPDLIVIAGGLASLGELLIAPARQVLAENALPYAADCPIVLAGLGKDAAVIGAASLAMPLLS